MREIWSGKSVLINCCLINLSCKVSTLQQFVVLHWCLISVGHFLFYLSYLVLLYKKCEFTNELSRVSCVKIIFCNGHFKLIRAGGRNLPISPNKSRQQLSYNWVVPWKYYLSAIVCYKEKQVLRIIRKKQTRIHHSATVCVYASVSWKLFLVVSWHPSHRNIIDWKRLRKG